MLLAPRKVTAKVASVLYCIFSAFTREGRDLGVAFQAPPGSQASSRGHGSLNKPQVPLPYYKPQRTPPVPARTPLPSASSQLIVSSAQHPVSFPPGSREPAEQH